MAFTSNLRAAEPERAKEIEKDYLEDLLGEYDQMYQEPRSNLLGPAQNRGTDIDARSGVPFERIGPNVRPMANPPVQGLDLVAQKKMYDDLRKAASANIMGTSEMPNPVNMYYPQNRGIAGIDLGIGVDDFTNRAMTGGYATRGSPRDSFAARDVAIDEIANMNPVVKGIHNVYAKMFNLGVDDQGNITPEALIDLKRRTQQTIARDQELGDDRRKDQEERERAALLAAQNQPVDPCPEGYRLDPMSKVCVPTDDTTTDTAPGTGRVYETMTKPQENYTAATNFNVPGINLPDIFTGS